jgi:hypothetical protein
MEHTTPRNIVIQMGALISLYLSIGFFIALLFSLITIAFPSPADGYWEVAQAGSTLRLSIAMVVVFFPTYLILTRTLNQIRRREKSGAYITFTKWLLYFSLLVGGGVILGDLVSILVSFLNGDLTLRFILKAVGLLIVVGLALWYYILDLQDYWVSSEKQSVIYGSIIAVLVFVTVSYAFTVIEPPTEVRERAIDEQQITDLRDMQWRIEEFIHINNTVPESLTDVAALIPRNVTNEAARAPYEYEKTESGFRLCATFSHDSRDHQDFYQPSVKDGLILNSENWTHTAGRYCFERIVQLRDE